MSDKEQLRRSSRRTQGIPPARFVTFAEEMPTQHSPLKDMPNKENQPPQQHPNVSTPPAISTNPPAQQLPTAKTNLTAQQLPPVKKPATSSPATTVKAANEVSELGRQMGILQQQMLTMQAEFMNSTKQLQAQIVSTAFQVQEQLASVQSTSSLVQPRPPLLHQPSPSPLTGLQLPSVSQQPSVLQPPPAPQPLLQTALASNVSELSEQPPYSQRSTYIPHTKIYPLPIFSGLPEEWQTFYEAFESTTSEFGYSDLHNIMRLREAVKGHARDTVESLLASSTNVAAIIEVLRESFGRPEQLIRSQIEKVKTITPVVNDNLEGLVIFANKINNMSTFLKNAKGEHHLSNPSLLSELVSKLPTNRQMQWAEKCLLLERPATVIDFSDWLSALRRLANIVHDSIPTASTSSRRQHPSTAPHSRKYAYTTVSRKCAVCQGECTSLKNCSKFLKMTVDDRWSAIKQLKACFCCLKRGHPLKNCYTKKRCGVNDCPKSHHHLLHNTQPTATITTDAQRQPAEPTAAPPPQHESRSCHATSSSERVLFQILPVTLYGRNKKIETYAFVDDGANVSMLDNTIARELGLRGQPETLELQWLDEHYTSQQSEKINLRLSGVNKSDKIYTISNVYLSSSLSLPIQSCHIAHSLKSHECNEIANIPVRDYSNVQPKLILSLSHSFLTVPLNIPRLLTGSGPIVSMTRLGAIIYGPIPGEKSTSKNHIMHIRRHNDEESHQLLQELHQMMRGYFDVETLGIKVNIKPLMSKENERALGLLKENTKMVDGRYECSLLWKEIVPPMPDSYQMALNRLNSVERKMAKDPLYARQYCDKINDYLKKGYARKITDDNESTRSERVFYLPHFGVKNVNKPGIRLVFDAAAEVHNNFSLNKALIAGPDLNNSLLSILFKFREAPIAVCGDIQEMFHQIVIARQDQDSQRFLWRDGDQSKRVNIYAMERMIFGATCSPTIAQYVKNLNANKFLQESPRAVHGIVERHYVDDYVDCFQSEDEAIDVVRDVIRIHKAGGFHLRNIISNSDRVRKLCGNTEVNVDNPDEFLSPDNVDRILGIHWMAKTDVFCFLLKLHKVDGQILNGKKIPTKREMLSLNMSIYDPFGFLCDFMVTSKVLMQKVWKIGVQWDEELPKEIYGYWKTWLEELPKLLKFSVPRCYVADFLSRKVDLHIFVDASEEAMAVVAYWRAVSDTQQINIAFVMGKTSCAPTRYHTTPKLELQAAVMGVRMKELILKNHLKNINRIYFWSDSYTVIQWIRSDHRMYKQYVANRVSEILDGSKIEDWKWCPGSENPADEATRAQTSKNYQPEGRWITGPAFLLLDESNWPDEASIGRGMEQSEAELRSRHRIMLTHRVCPVAPQFDRFSKYRRLRRTMAWVRRYVHNLLHKIKGETVVVGELTVQEETEAELHLCRFVQQQLFADEIVDLTKNGFVSSNSVLKTLNPFIGGDKLLRVSGRIENAAWISIEARQPIILPKKHQFTRLLVESYHKRFCHINTATTMSEVRLKFWVPSLRQLINSIQSSCQECRIRRAKPRQPQMAALPVERVTPYVRAFTYTGLDYFGPVTVSIGRRREKRWVALFTCLSVRAVHLEIAADLSSDACLVCIRNFVNRRGVPVLIRSDNGTNFVGIAKELQGVSNFHDNDSITAGLSALGIKWVFNTPVNPCEGGVWERLVQSVKKALYIMLKEQAPRLDTLQAFLIEAENIVNSRPLTHLPVTPDDAEPLTPNHFLLGCTNSTQTPAPYDSRLMCLRKQWRVVQNLKNGMWHQWIAMYLPELTRRTKWCFPSKPLTVGCLVFICDKDMPRSQWKRGRIIEVHLGKDGVARSAEVRTSAGVYRRPVSKLAILDVEVGKEKGEVSPAGSVHGGGDVVDGHLNIDDSSVLDNR